MKKFFKVIEEHYAKWHEFSRPMAYPVEKADRTNMVFLAVLYLFLYSFLTTAALVLSHFNKFWVLALVLMVISGSAMLFWWGGNRALYLKRFPGPKRTWRKIFHDNLLTVMLGTEFLIVYLLTSNPIPFLRLDVSTHLMSGNITYYSFVVAFLFVVLQPIIEGMIARGFVTTLVNDIETKPNWQRPVLHFWVPIIVGLILHNFASFKLTVLWLGLTQTIFYQWVCKKYGLAKSIQVNIVVNAYFTMLL